MLRSILRPLLNSVLQGLFGALRSVYNFDGVDDRGALQFRAINPDGDNTFEFWSPSNLTAAQVIISQNLTGTFASREFQLTSNAGGNGLSILIGGINSAVYTVALGYKPNTRYGLTLVGTTAQVFEGGLGGTLVVTTPITRGAAREPSAITKIGCNSDGVGNFNFFAGRQYDIKINGVLWPMADRNQSIQLPNPNGLGAELMTPSVLANPSSKGAQWTYLGDGRWQLTGDGTYNELILLALQPRAYVLEFEIESISGGALRCFSNSTQTATMSPHLFNSVGKHRFVLAGPVQGAYQSFVRHVGTINCVIKNISLKPLWTENATELVTNGDFAGGTTGWQANGGASLAVVAGQGVITTAAGQNSKIERSVVLEAGVYYVVSADIVSIASLPKARLNVTRGAAGNYASIAGTDTTATGKVIFVFLSPATDGIVQVYGDGASAGSVTVDNISIRKLDNLCNPLILTNTTSDRWQEVPL